MIRIGYLALSKKPRDGEDRSAWMWISKEKEIRCARVLFSEIVAAPRVLDRFDLLWWHYDDAVELPSDAREEKAKRAIRDFVRSGGSLFLSLLASQYVVELGLESNPYNIIRKGVWDQESWVKDYPDIRGFGSNQGHPIFADLAGAVFSWNPKKGVPYSAAFYSAPMVPKEGKVVAVERQYIRLNEDWRMITEYDAGKGKVLAAGSYFFFVDQRDRFRLHLEKLARNCFAYLAGKSRGPKTYWQFGDRAVTPQSFSSKPVRTTSQTLSPENSGLSITREPEQLQNGFFDAGGRRILIMGKEESGIQEVWSHPFRMMRNVRTGFRIASNDIHWFDQLKPRVTIRPESVTRVYSVGELRIEETIAGERSGPGGIVHYHADSNHPLELFFSAVIDQRIMWPHSDQATGSLNFGWDDGLNAFVVSNISETLTSVVGASRVPEERIAGQFSVVEWTPAGMKGISTVTAQVALGMRFAISGKSADFSVVFAGSGKKEALDTYSRIIRSPGGILSQQAKYFKNLLESSTVIESEDGAFNDGYRWALVGTDRFLVDTPGLGTSLMAGFGTTERGWDGGQKISGRPGYAWYFGRDACWTALAMLAYGADHGVREALNFLGTHQDLNGKILHEMTSSGHVHYDAADSTPLYIILMGRYVRTTNDTKYAEHEFRRMQRAVEFCFSTDTDHDHLIENTNVGHGWVEGGKLFPVHTEFYLAACWAAALEEASFVAGSVKKHTLAKKWAAEANLVRRKIKKEFWNEESQFYNFGKYADGTFNIEKTMLPSVPIYFGCTDPVHASSCLDAYASSAFTADWGVRIVGSDNPMFNPTGYHYGSVWPLFTGWTALAEFTSGRPLQGFLHCVSTMMVYQHWAAGYVEEVLNGETFQPAGVCSHQAWSESMVLQPLLEGMLGLRVDAKTNRITLRPWFPPHWQNVRVRSMRIGTTRIDCSMQRQKNKTLFTFRTGASGVTINFQPIMPLGTTVEEIRVGRRSTKVRKLITSYGESPSVAVKVEKKTVVEVIHRGGVGIVPQLPDLKPGQTSEGMRIISEKYAKGIYELTCEGLPGKTYDLKIVDTDSTILSVDNAILDGKGSIRIPFEGEKSPVRKTISVRLRPA